MSGFGNLRIPILQVSNSENPKFTSFGISENQNSEIPKLVNFENQEIQNPDSTKVKILVIGDNHFQRNNMIEMKEMCTKFLALIRKTKPDIIVNLGDTLHSHHTIHSDPLCLAINFLHEISELCPLYLLIGNHDIRGNQNYLSDVHPFTALKKWKNTTIIDKVEIFEIKGHKFLFGPYIPTGRLLEALKTISNIDEELPKISSCFLHQEFENAQMGAIISKNGDKWPLNYPLVVSGHIHEYQRVQENVIYVGCPMQHTYGTEHVNYTVSLFTFSKFEIGNSQNSKTPEISKNQEIENLNLENFENHKIENLQIGNSEISKTPNIENLNSEILKNGNSEIANHKTVWTERRIDLELPRKMLVHLKANEILSWQPPENSLVKVIILGTAAELKVTMQLSHVKELQKRGIKVFPKNVDGAISNTTTCVKPSLPYITKLAQEVNFDAGQKFWFEKIFGGFTSHASHENSKIEILENPNSSIFQIRIPKI